LEAPLYSSNSILHGDGLGGDGRHLLHGAHPTKRRRVGTGFTVLERTPLFDVAGYITGGGFVMRQHDVSGDGERFLMVKRDEAPGEGELVLVLNAVEAIEGLVGQRTGSSNGRAGRSGG
jgi:hypothetical protein